MSVPKVPIYRAKQYQFSCENICQKNGLSDSSVNNNKILITTIN